MTITGKKLKGWALEVVVAVALFSAITWWQTRDMLSTDGSVAAQAQNFPSLGGDVLPLAEAGQKTLVYFFAPWCQVCELSIDNLAYLNRDDLRVVTVALDYSSQDAVQDFITRNEVTAPVLLGTNALKQRFKIKGYPSYYLLDEELKVVGKSYGYSTALGMKLRALVAG